MSSGQRARPVCDCWDRQELRGYLSGGDVRANRRRARTIRLSFIERIRLRILIAIERKRSFNHFSVKSGEAVNVTKEGGEIRSGVSGIRQWLLQPHPERLGYDPKQRRTSSKPKHEIHYVAITHIHPR